MMLEQCASMAAGTHHDIQGFFATTEGWLVNTMFVVLTLAILGKAATEKANA
jgi:hypothetical protein